MSASLPILQGLILVVAGIVGGGGMMVLGIGWLGNLSGEEAGLGCASVGGVLVVAAGYIAIRALMA